MIKAVSTFYIITEYYRQSNFNRQVELDRCLYKNLNNSLLSGMILCVEDAEILPEEVRSHQLVVIKEFPLRPSFADLLLIAAEYNNDDAIFSIQNADIYWEAEDVELVKQHIQPGECYALSRWDVAADGSTTLFDRLDSQDVWVIRGEIIPIPEATFRPGRMGVDSAFCHLLQKYGYKLSNPSKSVHTYHLHASNLRAYISPEGKLLEQPVPPPYLQIYPHQLGEVIRTFYLHEWTKEKPPGIWIRAKEKLIIVSKKVFEYLFRGREEI